MKKAFLLILVLFLIFQFSNFDASAQCAMCRAAVESNIENGESAIGGGLNTGILYLMAIPYIIFLTIGICWYKASKKNKIQNQNIAA